MVDTGGGFDGAEGLFWPCDQVIENIANKYQAGLDFKKMRMLLRRPIPASGEIPNARQEMSREPVI